MTRLTPDQVTNEVRALAVKIRAGEIGREKLWGGADVCIVRKPPKSEPGGFYPDPKFVVTEHAPELSWLFMQLMDIFYQLGGEIFAWKFDFFGSLADAAEFAIQMGNADTAQDLLLAVCDSAAVLPPRYA